MIIIIIIIMVIFIIIIIIIIINIIIIIIIKIKAKNYMFQAIKINNYQNLLAAKNNRKVTFIMNQFQVSICSSTFSPCISPDKTLQIVLSLSINIVFCISPATCFANSFLFKTFDNSTITLFIPQIQIFFDSLSSKIKSGLLDVFVFRKLNSKSHTSLALPFFSTVPRSHLFLCNTVSSPISSHSFAHATAKIISTRLCLFRYSLSLILCNQQLKVCQKIVYV